MYFHFIYEVKNTYKYINIILHTNNPFFFYTVSLSLERNIHQISYESGYKECLKGSCNDYLRQNKASMSLMQKVVSLRYKKIVSLGSIGSILSRELGNNELYRELNSQNKLPIFGIKRTF